MNYIATRPFNHIISPLGNITRDAKAGQRVDFEDCPQHVIDYYVAEGYVEAVEDSAPARDPDADGVEIPENWQDLPWPELRSLASKLTDSPITTKADAVAAIEAELMVR